VRGTVEGIRRAIGPQIGDAYGIALAVMAVLTALGTFDASTGTVDVRGPFNNWGSPSGFILTNSPANPTLFAGTVTLSWTPGVLIRLQSTTSVTNGVWDDVPNTLGQASAVLVNDTFVDGAMFFRLTGP